MSGILLFAIYFREFVDTIRTHGKDKVNANTRAIPWVQLLYRTVAEEGGRIISEMRIFPMQIPQ